MSFFIDLLVSVAGFVFLAVIFFGIVLTCLYGLAYGLLMLLTLFMYG